MGENSSGAWVLCICTSEIGSLGAAAQSKGTDSQKDLCLQASAAWRDSTVAHSSLPPCPKRSAQTSHRGVALGSLLHMTVKHRGLSSAFLKLEKQKHAGTPVFSARWQWSQTSTLRLPALGYVHGKQIAAPGISIRIEAEKSDLAKVCTCPCSYNSHIVF